MNPWLLQARPSPSAIRRPTAVGWQHEPKRIHATVESATVNIEQATATRLNMHQPRFGSNGDSHSYLYQCQYTPGRVPSGSNHQCQRLLLVELNHFNTRCLMSRHSDACCCGQQQQLEIYTNNSRILTKATFSHQIIALLWLAYIKHTIAACIILNLPLCLLLSAYSPWTGCIKPQH